MNLITQKITLPEKYSITSEVESSRNTLVSRGNEIQSVTNGDKNNLAAQVVKDLRKYAKDVESVRVTLTKPLLDAQRLLKSLCDTHVESVNSEIKRIEKLGQNFLELENKRVREEEEKKRQEFLAAQADQFAAADAVKNSESTIEKLIAKRKLENAQNQVQKIINAPDIEVEKAKGQSLKKVLCYEVTDIYALVKARPDLCKIEAKASAINATCNPDFPILGLKLWWENKSNYSTR